MMAYNPMSSVRLGQVAYAQPYPPGSLEWGQGWGRFAYSTPKIVLPHSTGGIGYTSDGTVLSEKEVEEVSTYSGAPLVPAASTQVAPPPSGQAAAPATGKKFPVAAAGVAAAAILAALVA